MKKYLFAYPVLFSGVVLLGITAQGAATAISFFMMFVVDTITSGDIDNFITATFFGAGIVIIFFLLLWSYS